MLTLQGGGSATPCRVCSGPLFERIHQRQPMMRGTLCVVLALCFALSVGADVLCSTPKCPGDNEDCGGNAAGKCEDETLLGCSVKICVCVSGYVGGRFSACMSNSQLSVSNELMKLEVAANVQRRDAEKLEKKMCTDPLVPPLRPALPAESPHGTPMRTPPCH